MGRMRVSTLLSAGMVLGAPIADAGSALPAPGVPTAPIVSVGNSSSNGSSNGSDG